MRITLQRHKSFLKDSKNVKTTDTQQEKLFLYVSLLLRGEKLPKEAHEHSLSGEWDDFREFHIGGDMLVIYGISDTKLYLVRLGSHAQLFKKM